MTSTMIGYYSPINREPWNIQGHYYDIDNDPFYARNHTQEILPFREELIYKKNKNYYDTPDLLGGGNYENMYSTMENKKNSYKGIKARQAGRGLKTAGGRYSIKEIAKDVKDEVQNSVIDRVEHDIRKGAKEVKKYIKKREKKLKRPVKKEIYKIKHGIKKSKPARKLKDKLMKTEESLMKRTKIKNLIKRLR
jgi:hypothetical protein